MSGFKISRERFTMRSKSLDAYFSEVSKFPMLSQEEETELATIVSNGGRDADIAANKLVTSNLRFVVSVAKRYFNTYDTISKFEDLINEGNYGLIEAAYKYDPASEYKFISHAVWSIRNRMTRYLNTDARQIRFSYNVVVSIRKINEITMELTQSLGREPYKEEVYEIYDTFAKSSDRFSSSHLVENSIKIGYGPTPLEGGFNDPDRETSLIDVIDGTIVETDRDVEIQSTNRVLKYFVDRLSERDRDIVISKHGLFGKSPESLGEISKRWGVTKELIRMCYHRALRRLRNKMAERNIKYTDLLV